MRIATATLTLLLTSLAASARAEAPADTQKVPPEPKAASTAAAPATTRASTPHATGSLHWDPAHPRFRPWEYALTGAVGPVAFAEYFFVRPQSTPSWQGGILFDDAARDALRLRSPVGQRASWTMADGLGVSLIIMTMGLDSIVVPLANGSVDVAVQLTLMDMESFALSSLLAITLYDTVGRARPSYEDCQKDPTYQGCHTSPTASFPSGHINEAFTAAGLSCAHHTFMHLYGSRLADAFACGRDVTLATMEGVLRVMGDRHYVSDVIVGSAIGFAFGFGLPTLLHYVKWGPNNATAPVMIAPMFGPATGLVAGGAF